VSLYFYCPRCEARFDVTDCADGTRLVCDDCGNEFPVHFENLVLMPGGIGAEVKVLADGTRWLVCPKCGLSANISNVSSGNRFRCRRCNLLLQAPGVAPKRARPPVRKGDDILKCPGCRTRYEITRYSPGNRFRCRRCGMTLTVPPRGHWLRTGEWEIDADRSLIKCNRCNQSYAIDSLEKGRALICKKCRRVFSELWTVLEYAMPSPAGDRVWEIDVESGMIICPGCKFSYELTDLSPGVDFACKHCRSVFRMPAELPPELAREQRERIACPKCDTPYDVSGYLAGTMFSCQKCDTVIIVSGAGGPPAEAKSLPEPPAVRMGRDPRKGSERLEARQDSSLPEPDFSYSKFAKVAADREARTTEPSPVPEEVPESESPPAPVEPAPDAAEPVVESSAPEAAPPPAKEAAKAPPPDSEQPSPSPAKPSALAPFPPKPPEELPGGTPEGKKGKKKAKKGVRLIVRCTVCGTRHDAAGKSPGDTIRCVCGKKIRITAPKKKAKKAKKKPASDKEENAEDVLDKKALRSEDVDILEL
jgi:uncharacterized protein YbaR (Trm112 family)